MQRSLLANGGWLLRVVTISALIVVVGLSLLPRVFAHISTSATVNAPVMVIRSPIEGVVEEYALATGAPVAPGQRLIVFREGDTDRTRLTELEARLGISVAAGQAVAGRIAEVEALQNDLARRHGLYTAWHGSILDAEIAELEAELRGAVARLRTLADEADRQRVLFERGAIADSVLAAARNAREEQDERVRALAARLGGRRLMRAALEAGVLAGTTGTNTPYTLQRQDEIGLELARLRDELADHRAEQKAIRRQIATERDIYDRENRVSLVSPVTGVVWRSAALAGRPVLPGDEVIEVLDCSARFLEAFLPERLIGSIGVGDSVDVRLTGETRVFRAPVISVLGHGALFDHAELAARDDAPKTGTMRVLVGLGPEALGLDASRFCDVGRTAQVSLPRDLSGFERLAGHVAAWTRAARAWIGGGDAATADLSDAATSPGKG